MRKVSFILISMLLVLVMVSNARAVDIDYIRITSGFQWWSDPLAPVSTLSNINMDINMGSFQGTPGFEHGAIGTPADLTTGIAGYTEQYGWFFNQPIAVFTSADHYNDYTLPLIGVYSPPSGTIDFPGTPAQGAMATIQVNLESWTVGVSGHELNQGSSNVSGTGVYNAVGGYWDVTLEWSMIMEGGVFDGFTTDWMLENVQVYPIVPDPPCTPGDINQDGVLSFIDVFLLYRKVLGFP